MPLSACSAIVFLMASFAWAQTAADLETPAVNHVAEKLSCPCGCKLNMACRMDPYPCQTCRQAKIKIYSMQAEGKSDGQILDQFVKENGSDILAIGPGPLGVIGPYAALAAGLLGVLWIIRRMSRRPQPAAAVSPEILDQYQDRIEKDLAKLD
jgi:cytochrome c-type biogenesis protein CcmH/NrfF